MDPVSIIGLSAAIQQLLGSLYNFGQGVYEAKTEINLLCSELLALKAAFEHIQLNLQLDSNQDVNTAGVAQRILSSSNFATPEFKQMLLFTKDVLNKLQAKLDVRRGPFKSSIRAVKWPFLKDSIKLDIERLERSKRWFILATTSDNLMTCRESYLKICSIDRRLRNQEILKERRQSALFRKSIKGWLAPCDPYSFFERSLHAFQEGTGKWFLDEVLQEWLAGSCQPILWLRARPGVGKTTLLSAAVNRSCLLSNGTPMQIGLAYFFCSFTDQQSQEPENVFGSILAQLCDANPTFWTKVEDHYPSEKLQSQHQPQRLEVNKLESLIVECSEHFSKTILFVDALNESKLSSRIMQVLLQIISKTSSIQIMISSTEELGAGLGPVPATVVTMDELELAGDIGYYIDTQLQRRDDLHDDLRDLPAALKADIRSKLQGRAQGSFRWVQCQLETLGDQQTTKEIQIALQNVPSTLEQTYRNILARIKRDQIQMAKQTLFWLCFSLRPMLFSELCEAVITTEDDVVITDDMRLLRPEVLFKICGSLISYDRFTTRVVLAHSSVMQYLTSQTIRASDVSEFYFDEATADNEIAIRCLNYLNHPVFSSGYCTSHQALMQRFKEWPLLPYLADLLFNHLSYITLNDHVQTILLRFFETHAQPRGGNFGAWVEAFTPGANDYIETSTPLYYASRFGLLPIVKLILALEGTKNLEAPGGLYGSSPLHVATWLGRTDVVRELLKAGANAREVNLDGKPALLWAVKFGFVEIERMLRDAGAGFEKGMNLVGLIESTGDDSDEDEAIDWRADFGKDGPEPRIRLVLATLLAEFTDHKMIQNAFLVYDQVRRVRTQRVVSTNRDSGQLVGMRAEGVGSDSDKIRGLLSFRVHWIWNRDMVEQNREALQLFKESL